MPSQIRIFFWLAVSAVAWMIVSVAWAILFPTADLLAVLNRLPPDLRAAVGYLHYRWDHPIAWLPTLLVLAAIYFAFSGKARDWFARDTSEPVTA